MVVVTGGKLPGDEFTEAGAGADYLHTRGVPDEAILRETTSRNSWESLRASARFLQDRGITRVVLVSDPFHSLRIRLIAEEIGFDAVTSPTRHEPDQRIRGVAADPRRGPARRGGPHLRLRPTRPGDRVGACRSGRCARRHLRVGRRTRSTILARTFGGGVIGNTTGSGPVIGGSSPPPRARRLIDHDRRPAPSSSGLGRRPLKAVTAVRICSGLPGPHSRLGVRASVFGSLAAMREGTPVSTS